MRGGNKEGRESGREGGEERMGLAGLEMGIFGKVETGDPVFEVIVRFYGDLSSHGIEMGLW